MPQRHQKHPRFSSTFHLSLSQPPWSVRSPQFPEQFVQVGSGGLWLQGARAPPIVLQLAGCSRKLIQWKDWFNSLMEPRPWFLPILPFNKLALYAWVHTAHSHHRQATLEDASCRAFCRRRLRATSLARLALATAMALSARTHAALTWSCSSEKRSK